MVDQQKPVLTPNLTQQEFHARQAIIAVNEVISTIDAHELGKVAELIARSLIDQRKVMILGNGGSCSTASHLATDLRLLAREAQLRVSVESLHDSSSLVTAMTNDYGFAESGAALLEISASSGDVLLIFSCSGCSPNLASAAHAAARLGVLTILISSRLAPMDFPACHHLLVQSKHYGLIESAHSAIAHIIVHLLRIRFGIESLRHPLASS